jgi:putative ATPase
MNQPYKPLADRMRPRKIEEMVGQDHLLHPGSVLWKALRSGRIFSVIFWGPPGSGKTTLARLMAQYTQNPFQSFSAVTSGVKELREVIRKAAQTYDMTGKSTILFVDEIHRFNKAQQDAFLPYVESGLLVLVGATTQNPSFEIIPPLLSRARVMVLRPLDKEAVKKILYRAIRDKEEGLGNLDLEIEPDAFEHVINFSEGDARVALNNLEITVDYVAENENGKKVVTLKDAEESLRRKALPYDKDGEEHYNLISAFHKALRGSDEQASLYWLYRMLVAGEDPLFICRRMIRFASEDVGLADPQALGIALAAFEAWERVGPPEAELALAQAAVYLASAPKSNALYVAEKALKMEIEASGAQPVPLHIRNAPTKLMTKLGYGRGYLYPHNYPGAWVKQDYLPEKLKSRIFYRPTGRGMEKEIRTRMEERNRKTQNSIANVKGRSSDEKQD